MADGLSPSRLHAMGGLSKSGALPPPPRRTSITTLGRDIAADLLQMQRQIGRISDTIVQFRPDTERSIVRPAASQEKHRRLPRRFR